MTDRQTDRQTTLLESITIGRIYVRTVCIARFCKKPRTRCSVAESSAWRVFDVTAKAAKPCEVDGKTYKDGDEFKPNCSLLCTCQNGAYACASLCPQEDRAPSRTHCRDAQLVSIVGQCCREWVCPHVHSIAEPDDDANNNGN